MRAHAFGSENFLWVSRVAEEAQESSNNDEGGGHDAKPSPLRRNPSPTGMPFTHSAAVLLFRIGLAPILKLLEAAEDELAVIFEAAANFLNDSALVIFDAGAVSSDFRQPLWTCESALAY